MDHPVIIHEEEKENPNIYKSCCSVPSDKRLLTFIAMLSISIGTLSFCFSQLAIGGLEKDRELFYTGLISMIIGIWIKSPV